MSGGTELARIAQLDFDYHLGTYARKGVLFVKGAGMRLIDDEGREYLDFIAGIGSVNLGHAHPAVADAVDAQMRKLVQVSNLYYVEHRDELAERLVGLAGGGYKAFLCNSGTEAAEGAIKVARAWGSSTKGPKSTTIVAALRGFHGRTLGALAATGQPGKKAKFQPLPAGFTHVPFDDVAALEAAMTDDVCAIMLEPVQGEGGVYPASPGYLAKAAEIAHSHGALLILDEVQTGFYRTGPAFAYETDGAKPDVMCLAKSLANGLPAGAVLVADSVAGVMEPGDHGSTFGGGPVIAAAALATIDALQAADLGTNAELVGAHSRRALSGLGSRHPGLVAEVRGRGLMNAVEFTAPIAALVAQHGLDRGLVLNNTSAYTLRFLPPLVCDTAAVDMLVGKLDTILEEPEVAAAVQAHFGSAEARAAAGMRAANTIQHAPGEGMDL